MCMRGKELLCSIVLAVLITGCTIEDTSESKIREENAVIEDAHSQLREYQFHSAEAVERMSDEDLIYIAQNASYYDTEDFLGEGAFAQIDLYGVELQADCYEWIKVNFFWHKDLQIELDVTASIPEEEFNRLIQEDIEAIYFHAGGKESWEDTGSVVLNEETVFCGENDTYAEYSVRYTDRNSVYLNNVLTTTDIPRASREVYLKNYVLETNVEELRGYLLGELSLDYVKEQLDVLHSGDEPIIYREIVENEKEYIYTYYYTNICYGDYGLNDTAMLMRRTQVIDKETHVSLMGEAQKLRDVEIIGTSRDSEW